MALPAEALKHIHFDRDVGSVLEPLVNAVQVVNIKISIHYFIMIYYCVVQASKTK